MDPQDSHDQLRQQLRFTVAGQPCEERGMAGLNAGGLDGGDRPDGPRKGCARVHECPAFGARFAWADGSRTLLTAT